jgi:hypothetical protein
MENINTLRGHNVEILLLNVVVGIMTTNFNKVNNVEIKIRVVIAEK